MISLTCQLVVERHRLGHINDDMQTRILEARRKSVNSLPRTEAKQLRSLIRKSSTSGCRCVEFDYGRVNAGRLQAEEKVDQILRDVLDEMELTNEVTLTAADFQWYCWRRILAARQSIAGA